MRLLRTYMAVATLKGVMLVLGVLVAVAAFVEFVGQLDDVGTASYGLNDAIAYVALRVPRTVFNILPAAALLGALFSLGNLAVHRELTVMRASGVSPFDMLGAVAAAGFVLLAVMILLGESLAPSLGAYARDMRTRALLEDVDLADDQSAWLREGDRIINLRRPAGGTGIGGGVLVFELGEDQRLRQVARADSIGAGAGGRWVLANYAGTTFSDAGIDVSSEERREYAYDLNPDLLQLSVVRQDLLDTPGLQRYIDYLQANDLDANPYLIAYWTRIANIASVLLMTVLALPFVFGGLRSAGTGGRLLVGLVIGLTYYIVVQVLARSGEVFDLEPLVVAWTPLGVLFVITSVALLRMR